MASSSAITTQERQPVSKLLVPVLAIAGMMSMLNNVIIGPLMPEMSRDLSVSIPLLGQIIAAVFLGSAIVGLFAGPIGDQFGKKRLIVGGLVIVMLSAVGSALAPTFGWLFAIRLISAVSGGMMAGTTMAIAGTLFEGKERRQAIGTIASGMAAGPIVGLPTLTFIASLSSWRASMVVVGVVALALAALAQRVIPFDSVQDPGRIEVKKILAAYAPIFQHRPMIALYAAALARAIGWSGLLAYIGAYWADQHGFTVREIGWMAMLGGSFYFAGTKLGGSGRLADINTRSLFGITVLLCGLSFGAFISLPVDATSALAIMTIASLTGGIAFVAQTSLVSMETPAGQGTTMSLNAAMFTSGSALGGALGGVLLAVGGYGLLGTGLMGFMLLSAILVWHPAWLRAPIYRRQAVGE
jgi:predicted MFS family arabinose efflux permease